jgi:hypothetical protein
MGEIIPSSVLLTISFAEEGSSSSFGVRTSADAVIIAATLILATDANVTSIAQPARIAYHIFERAHMKLKYLAENMPAPRETYLYSVYVADGIIIHLRDRTKPTAQYQNGSAR